MRLQPINSSLKSAQRIFSHTAQGILNSNYILFLNVVVKFMVFFFAVVGCFSTRWPYRRCRHHPSYTIKFIQINIAQNSINLNIFVNKLRVTYDDVYNIKLVVPIHLHKHNRRHQVRYTMVCSWFVVFHQLSLL